MAPSISFPPAAQIEILNGSNWPIWSSRILTLLRMNGLRKHVTAKKTDADKDWDATEEMLLGILEMYTQNVTARASGRTAPVVHAVVSGLGGRDAPEAPCPGQGT